MTERRQDLMVGLFMLVGVVALGAMIVAFGEAPDWLSGKRYELRIRFDQLSDVQEGTVVGMRGIQIGRVKALRLKDLERPELGTYVIAQIEKQYKIPKGSVARVRPAAIGFGRSDIAIEVPVQANQGYMPTDGTADINGVVGSPLDAIIPERVVQTLETATRQIGELAKELTPVAGDLHALLQVRSIAEVETTQPSGEKLLPNLYTAVQQLYNALAHFNQVLGDPNVQSNVKIAIQNFRDVSEEAKATAKDIRALAARGGVVGDKLEKTLDSTHDTVLVVQKRVIDVGDKLSKILDSVGKATNDLAEGQGTAGMLLRDPKLYEEMVLTVQRLKTSAEDLQVLVKGLQEKYGVFVKGQL